MSVSDNPGHYVSFAPDNGDPPLTVLLDAPSPVISGGYGGWEVIDRPKRIGMTRFKGRDPFRQDIAIIFEGVEDDDSQEDDIQSLHNMALMPTSGMEPAKISLGGTSLRQDILWVVESIDWDNTDTMWTMHGSAPVRIRQKAVVHLLQYIDDAVIVTAPSPALVKPKQGKNKLTNEGMNLKQISILEYGTPDHTLEILFANNWLDADPRAIIPKGTPLFIPSVGGSAPKTFVVK